MMETLDVTNDAWNAFERLGYSRFLADKRINIYENCGKIGTLHYKKKTGEDIEIVIAGSRGEGVGILFDSDVDKVFVQRSVMCFDTFPVNEDRCHYDAEFLLDFGNVPSGYCKLRFMPNQNPNSTKSSFLKNVESALHKENGHRYVRNDQMVTTAMNHLTREGYLDKTFVYDVAYGPAKPFKCRLPCTDIYLSFDDVLAFRCKYPSVLNEWCKRHRSHDWPSADVIQKVINVDVLVVPVGEEEENVLQWRVSLVFAELALMHSFCDIQLKVYVTLKMLAKSELKKLCVNITSYVMKNVMFWISEKTGSRHFERNQLFKRIKDSLEYLKDCVREGYLPNYMIPERNILKNKMSEIEKKNVLQQIESLLVEGRHVLLRCSEIKEFLTNDVDTRERKIEIREMAEQSILSLYSLPPPEAAQMIQAIFKVDKEIDVVHFFRDQIFPKIRELNPFGFFHQFLTKTDEELAVYFITHTSKLEQDSARSKRSEVEVTTSRDIKRKMEPVDSDEQVKEKAMKMDKK